MTSRSLRILKLAKEALNLSNGLENMEVTETPPVPLPILYMCEEDFTKAYTENQVIETTEEDCVNEDVRASNASIAKPIIEDDIYNMDLCLLDGQVLDVSSEKCYKNSENSFNTGGVIDIADSAYLTEGLNEMQALDVSEGEYSVSNKEVPLNVSLPVYEVTLNVSDQNNEELSQNILLIASNVPEAQISGQMNDEAIGQCAPIEEQELIFYHGKQDLPLKVPKELQFDKPIIDINSLITHQESEISVEEDPEYIDSVKSCLKGRSKSRGVKRIDAQKRRHSSNDKKWKILCNHSDENQFCRISSLSETEINSFFQELYKNTSKIDQDNYLLNFINVHTPERLRRKNVEDFKHTPKNPRNPRMTMTYHLRNKEGEKIPVYSKSFESITAISRFRINKVAKTFCLTQESPREKRGGSRLKPKDISISKSIKDDIENYKCNKSHYSRKGNTRSYLHPELSVKIMWRMWKRKRISEHQPIASYSKYYSIFVNSFNLSFGHPRQDVCSFCTEMKVDLNKESDTIKKENLRRQYVFHKTTAKKFFQLMREKNPGTLSVCFDMMQNQPLPKLNVTDVFYSRQVWLYNLNFVICSDNNEGHENNILYTWCETESGRGPNEVGSCLSDFLLSLEERYKDTESPPDTLRLFSDSCSAQNKNMYIMGLLLSFINKSNVFKKIEHFFPVRGHSYMPADRTFGRIEKEIRKKKEILSPNEYHKIFSKYAIVKVFGKDFTFMDYKDAIKKVMKTLLPFKSTEQKVFTYIKGKTTVGVSQSYTASPVSVSVLRKGKSILSLNISPLPKQSHIKEPKRLDVKKLLKFFEIPDEAKEFYNDILNYNNFSENDEDTI